MKLLPLLFAMVLLAGCTSSEEQAFKRARMTDTVIGWENFLRDFPDGEETAAARRRLVELHEDREWQRAQLADSVAAYQEYLQGYPQGRFSGEALVRIANLNLREIPDHEPTPEELADHDCIVVTDGRQGKVTWNLYRDGENRSVEVWGKVTTLSQQLTPSLAMNDLGITSIMPRPFEKDVAEGRLVRVLEDWQLDPMVVSLVLPDRLVSARTRAFIDFFSAKYKAMAGQFELA